METFVLGIIVIWLIHRNHVVKEQLYKLQQRTECLRFIEERRADGEDLAVRYMNSGFEKHPKKEE